MAKTHRTEDTEVEVDPVAEAKKAKECKTTLMYVWTGMTGAFIILWIALMI